MRRSRALFRLQLAALLAATAAGCDERPVVRGLTAVNGPANGGATGAAGAAGAAGGDPTSGSGGGAPTGAVTEIAAGWYHSCALMADTSVRCWGFDYGGMLGKGTAGGLQLTPAPVTGLSGAIHVEADYTDSCAQLGDGSWRCWGSNNYGQLGDGTTTSTPTPIVVVGGKSVPWISLAEFHSCALWADQTVSCYGYNDDGRLGDGTTTMRTTPTPVPGVTGVTQIAAGDRQSCALLGGGTLSCWGADLYALGDGNTPQLVPGISDAIKVTAGTVFACALRSAGTVSCWGQNTHGELGNGGSGTSSSTPVPVSGLADVVDIEAGYSHVCALRADRTVACWGDNAEGEVGDGSRIDRSTPTVVQGLANVAQISLGATHSCALLDGGAVVCWGDELVATTTRDADPYVGRLTPTPISF